MNMVRHCSRFDERDIGRPVTLGLKPASARRQTVFSLLLFRCVLASLWVGLSLRPSVGRSVGHDFVKNGKIDAIGSSYNHFIIMRTHRWPHEPYSSSSSFIVRLGHRHKLHRHCRKEMRDVTCHTSLHADGSIRWWIFSPVRCSSFVVRRVYRTSCSSSVFRHVRRFRGRQKRIKLDLEEAWLPNGAKRGGVERAGCAFLRGSIHQANDARWCSIEWLHDCIPWKNPIFIIFHESYGQIDLLEMRRLDVTAMPHPICLLICLLHY